MVGEKNQKAGFFDLGQSDSLKLFHSDGVR